MARPPVVVVDTNVFGADLGMHRRSWGERRFRRAEDHIGRAEVVWPGPRLFDAYVRLRWV